MDDLRTSKESGYGRNEVAEMLAAMPTEDALDKLLDAGEKFAERLIAEGRAYIGVMFKHLFARAQASVAHERIRRQEGVDPMDRRGGARSGAEPGSA